MTLIIMLKQILTIMDRRRVLKSMVIRRERWLRLVRGECGLASLEIHV